MSANRIYWFSATGNSLVVAREIARAFGDCDLVHVADAINRPEPRATFERVGFVYPVYGWGPPRMVHEFVDRSPIPAAGYYFAIATHGGTVASGLQVLSRRLASRGVGLHAGFAVKEGHYQPDPNHAGHPAVRLVRAINGHPEERARSFDQRREEILGVLNRNASVPVEFDRRFGSAVAARIHRISLKAFANSERAFVQTDACTACGVCTRVCPRANISLEDGRLAWRGNCEGCFACVQWCPNRAIAIAGVPRIIQGHNPGCRVTDMIRTPEPSARGDGALANPERGDTG